MFRIDKSLVDNMNYNKSFVVITHKDNIKNEAHIEPPDIYTEPAENKEDILQRAKEEAVLIIEKANKDAEEIKQAAWQEGYVLGKEEAESKTAMQVQSHAKMVTDFLHKLQVYKQNLCNDLQNSILALSMDVAEKIVNMELKRNDTVYIGIIKKAVARLQSSDMFKLRVSKREYDKFFKDGTAWLKEETGGGLLDVICDPYMQEGECIVESDQTVISAGVPLQLNKIKRLMSEEMEHGH